MCELFGISARDDFYANDYLKAFYAHSDFHPHGWGLACVSRNSALVEKESVKASTSNYLRERLSQPITEKLLLAHIRYATIGNVEYKNCHARRSLQLRRRQRRRGDSARQRHDYQSEKMY